jgi:SagB-type dehydrogenase family enzyme
VITPFAVDLLQYLREPRSNADLASRFPRAPVKAIRTAIRQLARHGLIAAASRNGRAVHPLDSWGQWAPLASAYHFATKDPAIPYGEQHQQLEDSLALEPEPIASDAPARHSHSVRLPSSQSHDRFTQTLLDRRTWRVFGRKAVTVAQLAELLQLSVGVQRWGKTPQGAPVAFKTSPSAGARQPIVAYVAVQRVQGLRAGLYRYSASGHRLERIATGLTSRRLEAYVGRQWWFGNASTIVFLAGKVGRVTGRYDHPRAYRFLLLEAGHVCQTFCLTATWMGLAPFCTAALADSRIERDFGMSGIDEIVLYAAGVGTRPEGGYRQWPDHEPGRPYIRPNRASEGQRASRSSRRQPGRS